MTILSRRTWPKSQRGPVCHAAIAEGHYTASVMKFAMLFLPSLHGVIHLGIMTFLFGMIVHWLFMPLLGAIRRLGRMF